MSEIQLQIDGQNVDAKEGMTVFEAAREAGIVIPTLCQHDQLEPYGACRICTVEVAAGGWSKLVASCCYPVEEGLVAAVQAVEGTQRFRARVSAIPDGRAMPIAIIMATNVR